ncbi:2TM domain-containing protein [Croceitalea sp. MTPC5]|uniref:2TM domain-containing protein n=1 Tax=Croceitalea sp. MTPC5 TaxID=3056565 RepID=UPI002B3F1C80|nr:2TM domain-containing protein [Croceitalea sp. MTPC5]
MRTNQSEDQYIRAKERITELRKFYAKVLRGLVAVCIVAAINYYLNEWEEPWFLWVVFGVTVGILVRAFRVFNLNPFFGKDWEERKIKELVNRNEF